MSKMGLNSLYYRLNISTENNLERIKSEYKLSLLSRLTKIGYNILYLDPDTVVLKDVFRKLLQYTKAPYIADIMIGVNQANVGKQSESLPSFNDSHVLYVRKTQGAISLLKRIENYMVENLTANLQDSFKFLIRQEDIQVTGVGASPTDPLYPGKSNIKTQKEDIVGSDLRNLFQLGSRPDFHQNETLKIHILDPLEFCNVKNYLERTEKMGSIEKSVILVHSSDQINVEGIFKTHKLWYLDSKGVCTSTY